MNPSIVPECLTNRRSISGLTTIKPGKPGYWAPVRVLYGFSREIDLPANGWRNQAGITLILSWYRIEIQNS
jgi:hypothetical protein